MNQHVTMATVLKSQGYATGQFGKNHQGDRDEFLPTMHGFDEFLGNLYHLNAEEELPNRSGVQQTIRTARRHQGDRRWKGRPATQFLTTLKEFPPSQTPGSFNLDNVRKRIESSVATEH